MLLYSGLGTGTGVLVAQAFGRRDIQEVSKIAALGQMMAGICGACTAIPLVLFPGVILHWVGAQENIAKVGAEYFQLFAASTPFAATSAVATATFRSLSDTRTPMVIAIAAVALNTVLGFFPGIWRAPFSKIASSRRRSGYPDCTNGTVRRFHDCPLPPKEGADMEMAVGMLWIRQDP